jgi:carnitine-CoA ligase
MMDEADLRPANEIADPRDRHPAEIGGGGEKSMTPARNTNGLMLCVAGRDLPRLFAEWVGRTPDKPFLIWSPFEAEPQVLSYSDFWHRSGEVAAGLAARGVTRGDRLIIHMENTPEFLLTWLASARLGAIAVTTNTKSSADEMAYFAEKAEAIGVVTQTSLLHACEKVQARSFFRVVVGEAADGAEPFDALLRHGTDAPTVDSDPLDDLSVQFTSGTTARPKGVVWTHANAIWAAQANARHFRLQHEDICHTVLPLFHTNAQSYSLLGTLWVGGTLLLQPRFSASNFWPAAVRHKATWASLIPFCVKALLKQPIPPDHSFRLWAPAVALPRLVDGPIGIPTMGLWGMTETVTHGIVADPQHPGPEMAIGRPAPGYEVAVRRDDGERAGLGESGRLFIRGLRGVSLFKEYLDDPEATASAFDQEDWFDTGDRIRIDDSGDMFFLDRDKDMLKVGGENVAASEIEAVLLASGLVAEVAVVGRPHDMLDEVPVAFVIPAAEPAHDLQERLIALTKDKLGSFKALHQVYIVDSLPRSTLEKVAKNELRARLREPV